jgi:hypothetical protein
VGGIELTGSLTLSIVVKLTGSFVGEARLLWDRPVVMATASNFEESSSMDQRPSQRRVSCHGYSIKL